MKKIKIICTMGPSSLNKKVIKKFFQLNVDLFRLNMSHIEIKDLQKNINFLKNNGIKNICIDTEGAQIRTSKTQKKYLKKNQVFKIYNVKNKNIKKGIYLTPKFDLTKVKIGSAIKIGFDNLEFKIKKINKNFITAFVINPGFIDSNKGVHFQDNINLPPISDKDRLAVEIAKRNNIKIFALSFCNNKDDLNEFKKILNKKSFIISKIETKNGFLNRKEITKKSDAILIDRGDLSRYIKIEKIPVAQNQIILTAKKNKTPVYVATNLLESMINNYEPTRAESNDIYSSLKDGCSGLVLAAETAIGKNPVLTVKFLNECIKVFKKNLKNKLKLF